MGEIDYLFNIIDHLTGLVREQGDALYRQSLQIDIMKKRLDKIEPRTDVAMDYFKTLDWCRGCDNYYPKGSVVSEWCLSCHEADRMRRYEGKVKWTTT